MKILVLGLCGLFLRSPEGDTQSGGGDVTPALGEAQMSGEVSAVVAKHDCFLASAEEAVQTVVSDVEAVIAKPLSVVEELLHSGADAVPLLSTAVHNCSALIMELDELIDKAQTGLSSRLVVPHLQNTRAEVLAQLKNIL